MKFDVCILHKIVRNITDICECHLHSTPSIRLMKKGSDKVHLEYWWI